MSTTDSPGPAARPRARLPVFSWVPGYERSWLPGDLVAGLTVWAVLVPEALAYAAIAGVSPVVGLYAAPGALILYAAFGSSRHLVTGPMAATAALSAAAVGQFASGGSNAFVQLTITLALVVGILALVAGLLRLGFLASFISEPVMKGFIIGLALTIMVGQLPKLFGVHKSEGDFFAQFWGLLGNLGGTSAVTLLVGVLSLALVVGLKHYAPVLPGSLVAVLLGIIAVKLFALNHHGVEIVGHIQSGLPSFGLPDVAAHRYLDLAAAAVGVMLVGFAEGLGAAKTYATKNHYEIDVNRELIGLGAANLGAGLSSGMVVNGSLSKTAVNGSAGARAQLSTLVVAALAVITLLFLTGLFEDLPEATLSAIVIAALIELVDIPALARLYHFHTRGAGRLYGVAARPDFVAALAAMLGVLIFDTLPGLFIGIGVSLLLLIYRASRPHIAVLGQDPGPSGRWSDLERHPDNAHIPGILVLRPESGMFFANADAVQNAIRTRTDANTKAVILDAETIPAIDVTAVNMLIELADDLDGRGVELVLARDIAAVRDLLRLGQGDTPLRTFPTVRAAIDALTENDPPPASPGAASPRIRKEAWRDG